ncbi:MAG TPA: carboxylesterase family protein, partial [Cyclobacteriaceae bacterium]
KPVMVWLHGGGFSSGSAVEFPSYDGENLSRKEVVVVSINHRLNVLGFLDLSAYGEKYKYSANAGALDMVAALKWIQKNISNFGGDPNNVTIFGQSGGGAKVMCLLNTPSAKGLFHKAIIQSGSYLNRFIDKSISQKVSAAVLEELKLQPHQVDLLETIPYDVLDAAGQKALAKVNATLKPEEIPAFGLEWEPVLDGDFLPYQPTEPVAIELSKNIPLLVGSVKNEYTPFGGYADIPMEKVNTQLKEKYGDKVPEYIAAVKKAYPETAMPSDYIDIDFIFRPFVIKQANQKSELNAAPVFTYLFAWQSPVMDGAYKAFHCMDLPFVFNNIQRCEEMTGGGKDAYALADKVSEAWVQFAKTGNPNHKTLPEWPAYTSENGATMIFDTKCVLKNHHDKELMSIGAIKN